jgi:hypothetical protein
LIRGLPNSIKGEPADFTAVIEPDMDTAIIHLGERIDTGEKRRRLQGIIRKLGFSKAKARRNNKWKNYRV